MLYFSISQTVLNLITCPPLVVACCRTHVFKRLWLRVRYRIRGFIHYRYGTVSLTSSKQQYGTVSRFQSAIGTVPWLKLLGELEWPCCLTDMSVTFLQSSISLSSISAYETNTPRWSHWSFIPICAQTDVYKYSFCPRTLLDWNTLSAEVRLKYSLSASESASRLSHDTPAVKGDAHCWIFAEGLKNWRFNRKCIEIGLRYGNHIWGITLNSLLQVYWKLPYPIPVALGIRYRTCSVFNNGYGTVPADTSYLKSSGLRSTWWYGFFAARLSVREKWAESSKKIVFALCKMRGAMFR